MTLLTAVSVMVLASAGFLFAFRRWVLKMSTEVCDVI